MSYILSAEDGFVILTIPPPLFPIATPGSYMNQPG